MAGWLRKLFGRSTDVPPQPMPTIHGQVQLIANYVPPTLGHRFIALDVETANGHPASICQIGIATCALDGVIRTYGTLIDPVDAFDDFNISIHGIEPEDVQGKPTFDEVIEALMPVLTSNTVFQHSNFDKTAINAACEWHDIPIPQIQWHDSVRVAQRAWPEFKGNGGHGLAHLKNALGLTFRHHDALEDARAAAQVVLLAEKHTGQTFAEILAPRRKVHPPAVRAQGDENGPLFGHIAVFTGSLSISREDAASHAAGAGISVKTTVSTKTTLLIVGDQDLSVLAGHSKSSKHRKAEELIASGSAIRVIGESEFLALIGKG
ncbi:exonuclease domain-containing protein [Pseudotabrizicola sp. 4114]|uniref:exonuclease domain-containing protein n=1 Tax=Pseudotabrizicola sp. 4114 TaxID=2817731 RepID=UPI0028615A57|nr:DNA polymerase-3 subunit epsilon [Pseudorhodobacter sp. 4114]